MHVDTCLRFKFSKLSKAVLLLRKLLANRVKNVSGTPLTYAGHFNTTLGENEWRLLYKEVRILWNECDGAVFHTLCLKAANRPPRASKRTIKMTSIFHSFHWRSIVNLYWDLHYFRGTTAKFRKAFGAIISYFCCFSYKSCWPIGSKMLVVHLSRAPVILRPFRRKSDLVCYTKLCGKECGIIDHHIRRLTGSPPKNRKRWLCFVLLWHPTSRKHGWISKFVQ